MEIKDAKAAAVAREGVTKKFNINKQLRKGDRLSATLFNIVIEGINSRT